MFGSLVSKNVIILRRRLSALSSFVSPNSVEVRSLVPDVYGRDSSVWKTWIEITHVRDVVGGLDGGVELRKVEWRDDNNLSPQRFLRTRTNFVTVFKNSSYTRSNSRKGKINSDEYWIRVYQNVWLGNVRYVKWKVRVICWSRKYLCEKERTEVLKNQRVSDPNLEERKE